MNHTYGAAAGLPPRRTLAPGGISGMPVPTATAATVPAASYAQHGIAAQAVVGAKPRSPRPAPWPATMGAWSYRPAQQSVEEVHGQTSVLSPRSSKFGRSSSSVDLCIELTSDGPGLVPASDMFTGLAGARGIAGTRSQPQLRHLDRPMVHSPSRGAASSTFGRVIRRRPHADSPFLGVTSRTFATKINAGLMDDLMVSTHSPSRLPVWHETSLRAPQDEDDSPEESQSPSPPQLRPRAISDECVRFHTSSSSSSKPDSPRWQQFGRSRRPELRSPQRTTQPRSPRQLERRTKRRSDAQSLQTDARSPRRLEQRSCLQENRSQVWTPSRSLPQSPSRPVRSPRSEPRSPLRSESKSPRAEHRSPLRIESPSSFTSKRGPFQLEPSASRRAPLQPEVATFVPPPADTMVALQLSPWPGVTPEKSTEKSATTPELSEATTEDPFNCDNESRSSSDRRVELEGGWVYTGQWLGNTRHGHGTVCRPDGGIYDGQFREDRACGYGKFKHANGDVYEGEWLNDKAHGTGKFLHSDGSTYEGQWSNDSKSGEGRETWADGSVFEGEFRSGKKHGHGVFTSADGSTFKGQFVEDVVDGEGIYTSKNGGVFHGQWDGRGLAGTETGNQGPEEVAEDQRFQHHKAASSSIFEDKRRRVLSAAQEAMRVALLETKRALDTIAQDQSERALRAARLALVQDSRSQTSEEVELDESIRVCDGSATEKQCTADASQSNEIDPVLEAIQAFIHFIERQDVKTLNCLSEEAQQMLACVRKTISSDCGLDDVMVPLVMCQRICQNLQQEAWNERAKTLNELDAIREEGSEISEGTGTMPDSLPS